MLFTIKVTISQIVVHSTLKDHFRFNIYSKSTEKKTRKIRILRADSDVSVI